MKKSLDTLYNSMISLKNEFSYVSSDVELEKKTLNIPYKQMAFLQNEFSYGSSDAQL